MPPLPPSDFCQVQLTAEGAAFAKGGSLRVSDGRFSFPFKPDVPLRVAVYEWDMFLRRQHTPAGEPLFEIVFPAKQASPPAPPEAK